MSKPDRTTSGTVSGALAEIQIPLLPTSKARARACRRLPLVVNNGHFLLLPHKTFPNRGSRALRLTIDRLSPDWQARYRHPVVLVDTFVAPEKFSGPVYTANGWQELGATDGFSRVHRDF